MNKKLIALLFFMICSTAVFAARIDYKGEKPQYPLMEDRDDGYITWVYIAVPDNGFLTAPREGAGHIGETKFLERYTLCREYFDGENKYLLLGKLDEETYETLTEVYGWVNEKDVIVGIRAMRTKQSIFKKALIMNRIASMSKEDVDGDRLDVVPVYKQASYDSEILERLGLFKFYYIWKEYTNDDGEEFCLIGTRSSLSDFEYPQGSITGWVSKNRILEWDTRQAVQFYKKNVEEREGDPVKIYQSKGELEDSIMGMNVDTQPIAVEDMSVTEWQPDWTRFPLLDVKSEDGTIFQKVGYIGDQLSVKSGKVIGNRMQVSSRGQQLEKLQQQIKNIDIVIAIDGTGSMFKFYKYINEGLKKTIQQISDKYGKKNKIDKPNIRFAVVFYRDYYDDDGVNRTYKFLPLTDDLNKVDEYISSEQIVPGYGVNENDKAELTEAIFYSLYNSIEQLEFNEGSFRQLIVVGDFGNHDPDP